MEHDDRKGHPARRSGVVLAAALALTAGLVGCGQSSGRADNGRASATTATTASPPNGSTAATPTDPAGSGWTRKLPAHVRVVDLVADDAGAGTDLDVWAGTPQAGRKLTTVRFGTQSPSFAPVANQYSQGRKVGATTVYGYQLSFLVAGTTPASVDTQQQEDAYPGDEVLIVVTSLEGASGEARYNLHVYFPKIGALRASEGDTGPAGLFSGIQAPQGKRLVILDASGLVGLADGTSGQATTYDVGDGTGCAEEINRSDQPGPGPGTRTTIGRGSFADFAYALPAASTKADIYASPGPCTGQPAASADLTHDAGSNVLALLYGPPHALRTMVLPE